MVVMLQRENKMCEAVKVDFKLRGKMVFFVTGNIHKFNEVRSMLSEYEITVGMLKTKGIEIQSDDLTEIAVASATDAFRRCRLPLIVEDAGLFVELLNGFPGPYSAYVYKTLGNAGLLKLLENVKNRKAAFKSTITYIDGYDGEVCCFEGQVNGLISIGEKKKSSALAFGFDPIFIPDGDKRTFAQMSITDKNNYSHRAKAINKFANWYKTKRQ